MLAVVFLLSSTGCSLTPYKEGAEYIVTALGIDQTLNGLTLTVESIPTNSEDTDSLEAILLKGEGETLPEAYFSCMSQAAEPFLLGHVGLIVFGEGVKQEIVRATFDWFYSKKSATLATLIASAESAEKLLDCSKISSVAVGYDAVGMLRSYETNTGVSLKNSFFEIKELFLREESVAALPYLAVEDDAFFVDGLLIYKDYSPCFKLTGEDVFFFSVGSHRQTKGSVVIAGKAVNITGCDTKLSLKDGDKPKAVMSVRISTARSHLNPELVYDGITRLFYYSKELGIDLFGLNTALRLPIYFSDIADGGEILNRLSFEVTAYE